MRMRKKKNGEARLAAVSDFLYKHSGEPLCDPSCVMNMSNSPVYLEIGAGKGGFACNMAKIHTGAAYFAMERVADCVVWDARRSEMRIPVHFVQLLTINMSAITAKHGH